MVWECRCLALLRRMPCVVAVICYMPRTLLVVRRMAYVVATMCRM